MDTRPDCLPCFLNQALHITRRIVPQDAALQLRVLQAWSAKLSELGLNRPPPALAGELYPLLTDILGSRDPFREDKAQANRKALHLLPRLRETVRRSPDRLRAALNISIIGNYIDSGVAQSFDWESAVHSEEQPIDADHLAAFRRKAGAAQEVLILGDNAGEIVLDMLLVQELQQLGCQVTYAVRGRPIINDATLEDAEAVGMTRLCRVVSSGVDTPGTVLDRCAEEFMNELRKAPLVLSKGQGNFEALAGSWPGVSFAFKVKCGVVARESGEPQGRSVFRFL
jgi:hypothetical protein